MFFLIFYLFFLCGCNEKNNKLVIEMEKTYCEKFYEVTRILENTNDYSEEIIKYYNSEKTLEKIIDLEKYGEYMLKKLENTENDILNYSQWKIYIESNQEELEALCKFSKKCFDRGMYFDYIPTRDDLTIEEITIHLNLKLRSEGAKERVEQIKQSMR